MSRVALVTGGTRGIGEDISIKLKDAGYTVAANYAGNDAAAAEFSERTGIKAYKFDVSDFDAVHSGIAAIEADLGPIEVLVNNAGITRDGTMHRMTFDQWDAVIQTNLASCFNCSRAVIEGMREREFGRIVNIGSINGQCGQYGQVNYAAAPGYVETDMVRAVPADVLEKIIKTIPAGRLGHVDDISRGVLFLVSDDASFITGATLDINGGQHMY
jgi:acetoacetyl-CoA reductase